MIVNGGHFAGGSGKGTDPPSDSVSSDVSSDSSSDSSSSSGSSDDYGDTSSHGEHRSDRQTRVGGRGVADQQKDEVKQVQKLSQNETSYIRFWRLIVLAILIVAGVAVATSSYYFLSGVENHEYLNRYFLFTDTIKDASQVHIQNVQLAVQGLSQSITASQRVTGESFPFLTVPVFEVAGAQARISSGIEAVAFLPLVAESERTQWSNYSVTHQEWLQESREIAMTNPSTSDQRVYYVNGSITPFIYEINAGSGEREPAGRQGPYTPVWQQSPPPFDPAFINYNMLQLPSVQAILAPITLTRESLFTRVVDLTQVSDGGNNGISPAEHVAWHEQFGANASVEDAYKHPHALKIQPIFRRLNHDESDIVGVVSSIVPWDIYMTALLPGDTKGIFAILKNSCGQVYSYALQGRNATYLGEGDYHDPAFDHTEVVIPLYRYKNNDTSGFNGHCEYSMYTYASEDFQDSESGNVPIIFTAIVAGTFAVVVLTFLLYDFFVERRNAMVVNAAARSNAILSSLFPSNVRERLFAETEQAGKIPHASHMPAAKSRLRSFLDNADGSGQGVDGKAEKLGYEGKPIADLFPETTVLFADIAGFTAWSSVREPAQVFTLLETLYRSFDEIAHRRRVFKVETVGDCYVAVTGLPDPQKDHAVIMARFARDCMIRTRHLTKKLETSLGPDTGELNMRMGMHSGQVTGGVLRGERSRFQLFGDTMNTASRMETTSETGRIQISQETADLLIAAGKSEWIFLREEKIVAKGKGEMQTYWLATAENRSDSASTADHSVHSSEDGEHEEGHNEDSHVAHNAETHESKAFAISNSRTTRLIEWNVDVLLRLLKQIVARRNASGDLPVGTAMANETQFELHHAESGKTAIDEVKEIITLPKFNAKVAMRQEDPDNITLATEVVDQLYDYVSNIAAIYNENPFHNFEHASHVTMSVVKLLSRIVAPSEIDYDENAIKTGKSLHDHTYGITSDPLTQFACVFSALIHDADHSGVPNAQLVKEKAHIAEFYKGKSVAEQNSVDLAWHLLMDDTYTELRRTIYHTDAELKRFRQLVVNSVMATDIVDKELKTLRNARWAKAFSEESATDASRDGINRKATIVIEHLIQASDVAHTMQHWHIYRKWNERFFLECYVAFQEKRAEKDPSAGWYQGELGFFDFYIIPLAKKLKDCGVFGVSSDEYLNYAVRNRKEWEERGREVVDEMIEMVNKKIGRSMIQPVPIQSPQLQKDAANPA